MISTYKALLLLEPFTHLDDALLHRLRNAALLYNKHYAFLTLTLHHSFFQHQVTIAVDFLNSIASIFNNGPRDTSFVYMSSATRLSSNDRAVLGALFDPEASLDRGNTTNIQQNNTKSPSTSILDELIAAEQQAIRPLNISDPSQTDVVAAITQLTALIAANPSYSSAYNNRAQTYRLLRNSDSDPSILHSVLSDLNKAISLSTPTSQLSPASPYDARVLASAHTHRGYLLLRASTSPSLLTLLPSLDVPLLGNARTPSQFEELASADFAVAGRYGNKTARDLAVKTNPYAKLCGQIVREALQREITAYYEGNVSGECC